MFEHFRVPHTHRPLGERLAMGGAATVTALLLFGGLFLGLDWFMEKLGLRETTPAPAPLEVIFPAGDSGPPPP